jgi:UDP-glucose 4-epimerase
MKVLVTGAAGFIGSNLVDRLLADGHTVVGVDNLFTGRREFIKAASQNKRFRFYKRDLTVPGALDMILKKDTAWVFHLAANADVRDGLKHPRKDVDQNILVTFHVLESMRKKGVRQLVFSSTGSIYGETSVIPTPEDCPFPVQTSLYGASKLSAEGLISAYAEGFHFKAFIFRFVSILGERYSHGHVFDFLKQLTSNPKELRILGNGKQRKSYLYIGDCVNAILTAIRRTPMTPLSIYNLGTDEYVAVNDSIDVICEELGIQPRRKYAGGDRGWVGDNPFIFLDCSKIRSIGWSPKLSIREGVRRTVRYLLANPWLLKTRR